MAMGPFQAFPSLWASPDGRWLVLLAASQPYGMDVDMAVALDARTGREVGRLSLLPKGPSSLDVRHEPPRGVGLRPPRALGGLADPLRPEHDVPAGHVLAVPPAARRRCRDRRPDAGPADRRRAGAVEPGRQCLGLRPLRGHLPPGRPPDVRTGAAGRLAGPAGRDGARLRRGPAGPAADADGRRGRRSGRPVRPSRSVPVRRRRRPGRPRLGSSDVSPAWTAGFLGQDDLANQFSALLEPSGRVLLVFVGGRVELWDVATGRRGRTVPAPFRASPDGRFLVATEKDDQGLSRWNVLDVVTDAWVFRSEPQVAGGPYRAEFTADGRYLLLGGWPPPPRPSARRSPPTSPRDGPASVPSWTFASGGSSAHCPSGTG